MTPFGNVSEDRRPTLSYAKLTVEVPWATWVKRLAFVVGVVYLRLPRHGHVFQARSGIEMTRLRFPVACSQRSGRRAHHTGR